MTNLDIDSKLIEIVAKTIHQSRPYPRNSWSKLNREQKKILCVEAKATIDAVFYELGLRRVEIPWADGQTHSHPYASYFYQSKKIDYK